MPKDPAKQDLDSFLASNQFRIIDSEYDARAFGNFYQTWQSASIQVRLVQDKDQQFIDISHPQDNSWLHLDLIKCLLEGDLNSTLEISAAVSWLKLHFLEIQALFGAGHYQETKRRIESIAKMRAGQMFPPS